MINSRNYKIKNDVYLLVNKYVYGSGERRDLLFYNILEKFFNITNYMSFEFNDKYSTINPNKINTVEEQNQYKRDMIFKDNNLHLNINERKDMMNFIENHFSSVSDNLFNHIVNSIMVINKQYDDKENFQNEKSKEEEKQRKLERERKIAEKREIERLRQIKLEEERKENKRLRQIQMKAEEEQRKKDAKREEYEYREPPYILPEEELDTIRDNTIYNYNLQRRVRVKPKSVRAKPKLLTVLTHRYTGTNVNVPQNHHLPMYRKEDFYIKEDQHTRDQRMYADIVRNAYKITENNNENRFKKALSENNINKIDSDSDDDDLKIIPRPLHFTPYNRFGIDHSRYNEFLKKKFNNNNNNNKNDIIDLISSSSDNDKIKKKKKKKEDK
jgi:hypothetical protein